MPTDTIQAKPSPSHQFPVIRHFQSMLRRSVNLTPDTKHLEWEIADGSILDFKAGQFVTAGFQNDEGMQLRPYSIASPPRGDSRFDLCLNRVEGGLVSNYLCDLQTGASIHFNGPYGSFVVGWPIDRDLVFLATGTGIAPFRSMLFDLFQRESAIPHEICLIFGARFAEGLLYREEFEGLQRQHSKFHFVPVVSRPSPEWSGATGHVQGEVRKLFFNRNDFRAYLCGVKGMVEDVRTILRTELGLERDQIRYEEYV